jgi:hypothetical protein
MAVQFALSKSVGVPVTSGTGHTRSSHLFLKRLYVGHDFAHARKMAAEYIVSEHPDAQVFAFPSVGNACVWVVPDVRDACHEPAFCYQLVKV